ncbi:MAG: metallophosphoesterase [Kofleriaceae bacterium]
MSRLVLFVLVASCYHLPIWTGKVSVKAFERKSLAKCGDGATTDDGAKLITRSPYLQSTTTTSTTIVWGSTDGSAEVVVTEPGADVIARVPAVYAGAAELEKTRLAAQKTEAGKLPANDIFLVKAVVAGLQPTHLYCYQIVAGERALTKPAPFTTAAAPGTPDGIRFLALGDSGTGGEAQLAIAQRMTAEPFDLMLFLGDIAYEEGTATQLQTEFFAIYRDILRYVPVYPTIGNHERRTARGAPYFEAFVLPEPERYYSFDWGDVHFVAIDTTHRDAEQLVWLDKDLTANKLPWTIVYGHHPMYTNSLRGPQMWVRRSFAKIVTDHKVDLVLSGHEHQYERFKVAGVNYVVSGGGGGQLTRFYGTSRALKQATVHHFLAFDVTATKLVMRAIDISGNEIESLSLTKAASGVNKTKVDGKTDNKVTPIPPETKIVPDEKVHDGPDDDVQRDKATGSGAP